MQNLHTSIVIALVALSSAFSSACSSGGGGSMSQSVAAGTASTSSTTMSTSSTTTTPTFCGGCVGPSSNGANSDTGIAAGPIAAPLPALFGSAPAQIATPASPTFDGSNGSYPANVTFPLISTNLKAASSGMSAVSSPDATLTVVSTSANSTNFQLVIPSLNLNENFTNRENIVNNTDGWTWGYS